MYTAAHRESLSERIIEAARADPRISGVAITGSLSVGAGDRWSDIDLAFGVRDSSDVSEVLSDFNGRMYDEFGAVHHVDVRSGSWVYRVFLLANTLQVDLAFAPAADFGAKGPTFRLVSGEACQIPKNPLPSAEELIGFAWLYALHVRSSIVRGKFWQAEHMLSGVRNHVLALACLRHGLQVKEGRGIDQLPEEVLRPLEATLIKTLSSEELIRAFRAAMTGLMSEITSSDKEIAARLETPLQELVESAQASLC